MTHVNNAVGGELPVSGHRLEVARIDDVGPLRAFEARYERAAARLDLSAVSSAPIAIDDLHQTLRSDNARYARALVLTQKRTLQL